MEWSVCETKKFLGQRDFAISTCVVAFEMQAINLCSPLHRVVVRLLSSGRSIPGVDGWAELHLLPLLSGNQTLLAIKSADGTIYTHPLQYIPKKLWDTPSGMTRGWNVGW